MRIIHDRVFERQLKKLSQKLRAKLRERLNMLTSNELNLLLNDHDLGPPYETFRSINITGDYRLVYKRIEQDTYYLRAVGTHHQLYGT